MELTLPTFLSFLQGAGLTGALVFFLYGGFKKWWVWGYQLEECQRQREAWQNLALKNFSLADRTMSLVEPKKE